MKKLFKKLLKLSQPHKNKSNNMNIVNIVVEYPTKKGESYGDPPFFSASMEIFRNYDVCGYLDLRWVHPHKRARHTVQRVPVHLAPQIEHDLRAKFEENKWTDWKIYGEVCEQRIIKIY